MHAIAHMCEIPDKLPDSQLTLSDENWWCERGIFNFKYFVSDSCFIFHCKKLNTTINNKTTLLDQR